MERREAMKCMVGGAAGVVLATSLGGASSSVLAASTSDSSCKGAKKMKKYPNSHYYKDGVFQPEVAKAAYFEMFEFFNYSLTDSLRNNTEFWVAEFGLGDFSNAGMAGIFWLNDKEYRYFAHEIYLLPGQMIPEHFHLPAEGLPAKHESWHVRNGSIYTFEKGGVKSPEAEAILPKSQLDANAVTCFKFQELKQGGFARLSGLGDPHFMVGGPNGAIVSEYGSYHSFQGLGFTNKKAKP